MKPHVQVDKFATNKINHAMKKTDSSEKLSENLESLEELNSEIESFEYVISTKKNEAAELKKETLKFLEKFEKRLTNVSGKLKIIRKSKK